jgi:hypothetical protein
VGLARDSADTDDGVVVYDADAGAPTDLAVWVDGTAHPVTGVEWVDSSGTHRPVTEWHLGPRSLFEVTITGTNSPVTAGETLDVTADVTNSGAATASDTIILQTAVQTYDAVTVSDLPSGATTSITLSWDTQSGDDGDYTFEVASSDDTASTSVTVEGTGGVCEDGTLDGWTTFSNNTTAPVCDSTHTFEASSSLFIEELGDSDAYAGAWNDNSNISKGFVESWFYNDGSSNARPGLVFASGGSVSTSTTLLVQAHPDPYGSTIPWYILSGGFGIFNDDQITDWPETNIADQKDLMNQWYKLRVEFDTTVGSQNDVKIQAYLNWTESSSLPSTPQLFVDNTYTLNHTPGGKIGLVKRVTGSAGHDTWANAPVWGDG